MDEDFPPLGDNAPSTTTTTASHERKRIPSAGSKDRTKKIELGFDVKKSERLFRLTGGKVPKEKGGKVYEVPDRAYLTQARV